MGAKTNEQDPPSGTPLTLTQLEQRIAAEQRALEALAQERQAKERLLAGAFAEATQIQQRIRELKADVAQQTLRLMTLVQSTDSLLQLREQLRERASIHLRETTHGQPSPDVQRASLRVPLAVHIGIDGPSNLFLGASENISEGGVFVASFKTRPVGDRFTIEFTLPDNQRAISAVVEVAWLRQADPKNPDSVPGMGLRFLALDPADAPRLTALIAQRAPLTSR